MYYLSRLSLSLSNVLFSLCLLLFVVVIDISTVLVASSTVVVFFLFKVCLVSSIEMWTNKFLIVMSGEILRVAQYC